eukprot:8548997-Pyramimonas_sp.AAC.1
MRTAKAFPCPFPSGCSTRDFAEEWGAIQDPAGEVSESWKQFIGVTEQYLCDLAGPDIGKYGGRGDGPGL